MSMVLSLLPQNNVEAGIEAIEGWMMEAQPNEEITAQIHEFIRYLRRQWLPLDISVHGEDVRTNNAVEGWHAVFMRLVGRNHPNIWRFIHCLRQMEHSKACDAVRLRRGEPISTYVRRSTRRLNQQIRDAERELLARNDIGHFLRRTSYYVRGLEGIFNPEQEGAPPALEEVQIPNNNEQGDDNPEAICQYCQIEDATDIFIPCGHRIICQYCLIEVLARDMMSCPICRQRATEIITVRETGLCGNCNRVPSDHLVIPCGHNNLCAACAENVDRVRVECITCHQPGRGIFQIFQ